MKGRVKIMLAAGEASGDLHGAALVKALRKKGVEVFGLGGLRMAAAGMRLDLDMASHAVIGFVRVLLNFPFFYRAMKRAEELLRDEKPDLLVIIDNPGFNLRLARSAKAMGIQVCGYISPQIWAWKKNRVHGIKRDLTRMLVTFPFEKKIYDQVGLDCHFVGNPLLDAVQPRLLEREARKALGALKGQKIVGLLPGSRKQEVAWLLPVMLEAARFLLQKNSNLLFVLLKADGLNEDAYTLAHDSGLPLTQISSGGQKDIYGLRRTFDAVMVSSGTATLETALLATPMVLLYRVHAWEYAIGRWLVKLNYIGLPNVVAGKKIIPEFIQGEMTAERVAAAVWGLLDDVREAQRQRVELKKVRARLGSKAVAARAAALVLESAQT